MHYDIDTISMIPILEMNKLGLREVKQFAWNHTARKR